MLNEYGQCGEPACEPDEFYQNGACVACATRGCSGRCTRFECISCQPDLLFANGACEARCGTANFSYGGQSAACTSCDVRQCVECTSEKCQLCTSGHKLSASNGTCSPCDPGTYSKVPSTECLVRKPPPSHVSTLWCSDCNRLE